MRLPRTQKKLAEIGRKYGLSAATSNDILMAYWEYAKNIMESSNPEIGYYPTVMIRKLGKFIVTEERKFVLANKIIPRHDQLRYKILQSSDRLSGDAENNTPETIEGEDTLAG